MSAGVAFIWTENTHPQSFRLVKSSCPDMVCTAEREPQRHSVSTTISHPTTPILTRYAVKMCRTGRDNARVGGDVVRLWLPASRNVGRSSASRPVDSGPSGPSVSDLIAAADCRRQRFVSFRVKIVHQ